MGLPCTTECCAPCCGIFSCVGIVFLIILGVIIDKQPQFVHGIEHPDKSSKACFGGAGIYAGVLAMCIFAYIYDQKKKKRRLATAGLLKEEQVALNAQRPGSYGTDPHFHTHTLLSSSSAGGSASVPPSSTSPPAVQLQARQKD